jgi:hypothetical protein
VAPLRLGGLRGRKSTPSVWLGGIGGLIEVGKQEWEQLGAGAAGAPETLLKTLRSQVCNSLVFYLSMYIFLNCSQMALCSL